jgi:hypothetical protein
MQKYEAHTRWERQKKNGYGVLPVVFKFHRNRFEEKLYT